MADQNKKKYIKYEDTTYELVDGEARERLDALEASASFRITSHPADAAAVGSGYAAFRVAALGTGLTFQWQYKTPSGSWKNCTSSTEGYNADTLVVQGANGSINRNGYQYRCVVSNGAGASAASNPATLTVLAAVAQSGSYNDLTDKPSDPGGGSGTVTSVNNVQPDSNGNVSLSANDVGAGTYSKPSGGIPDSDIASAATWNAKGTYSKPSGGIPASDLAPGVIPTGVGGLTGSQIAAIANLFQIAVYAKDPSDEFDAFLAAFPIYQDGSVLAIIGGVTASLSGSALTLS